MNSALRIACIAAAVATGCSYVVVADRSKVSDNLFQPSAIPDAGAESGDETVTGDETDEGGEAGESDASDEGADGTGDDGGLLGDGAISPDVVVVDGGAD